MLLTTSDAIDATIFPSHESLNGNGTRRMLPLILAVPKIFPWNSRVDRRGRHALYTFDLDSACVAQRQGSGALDFGFGARAIVCTPTCTSRQLSRHLHQCRCAQLIH